MTLDDMKRRVAPPQAVTELRLGVDGQTVINVTIENCMTKIYRGGLLVGFRPEPREAQARCLVWGYPAIFALAEKLCPEDPHSAVVRAAEALDVERRALITKGLPSICAQGLHR